MPVLKDLKELDKPKESTYRISDSNFAAILDIVKQGKRAKVEMDWKWDYNRMHILRCRLRNRLGRIFNRNEYVIVSRLDCSDAEAPYMEIWIEEA